MCNYKAWGKSIICDGFAYGLDRASDKVIDWRCMNTKSKCKARIRTDQILSTIIC